MIVADIKDHETYTLAFDLKLLRPGCVLLQTTYGCNSQVANLFNTNAWLLAPTEDLEVYHLSGQQLKQAVEVVNRRMR